MVGKVDCYLKVLIGASANNMPNQQDITDCTEKDIPTDALNIKYDEPEAADACLQNTALQGEHALPTHRPGKGTWYMDEYQGTKSGDLSKHDKLTADSNCA